MSFENFSEESDKSRGESKKNNYETYNPTNNKIISNEHQDEELDEKKNAEDFLNKSLDDLFWEELSSGHETDVVEDTPVSVEFLDFLSAEDIKSIFNNGEIKENLVKEDENWKKYIIIKWKRFNLGKYEYWLHKYKKDNGIIFEWTNVILWTIDCYCQFDADDDTINISYEDKEIQKFSDWRSLMVTRGKNDISDWSANGINLHSTKFDNWYYYFPSNNSPDLKIPAFGSGETLWTITSILSKIKDSKEPCKIIDEYTLQVWDTPYKFPLNIADKVAEWIDNYYN